MPLIIYKQLALFRGICKVQCFKCGIRKWTFVLLTPSWIFLSSFFPLCWVRKCTRIYDTAIRQSVCFVGRVCHTTHAIRLVVFLIYATYDTTRLYARVVITNKLSFGMFFVQNIHPRRDMHGWYGSKMFW